MNAPNPAPGEFRYDILMEDADGRNLRLESTRDLNAARERLPALAAALSRRLPPSSQSFDGATFWRKRRLLALASAVLAPSLALFCNFPFS